MNVFPSESSRRALFFALPAIALAIWVFAGSHAQLRPNEANESPKMMSKPGKVLEKPAPKLELHLVKPSEIQSCEDAQLSFIQNGIDEYLKAHESGEMSPCIIGQLDEYAKSQCEHGPNYNSANCRSALRQHRARLIASSSEVNQNLAQMPLPTLVNKFIGLGAAVNDEILAQKQEIARAILEAAPENPDTYKILASLSFYENDPSFSSGLAWIETGLKNATYDEQLEDLFYYFHSVKPDDSFDILYQQSQTPSARFYQAGRLVGSGNLKDAENLLEQLVSDEPGNERYQTALKNLRSGDPTPVLPQFNINHIDW
ncbi:MAG: hypothetical protein KF681_08565 [Bdellovibrionaceae bacterium]|nr:hypothetical protein [Pseudobdellovibrionaceae bacterium]